MNLFAEDVLPVLLGADIVLKKSKGLAYVKFWADGSGAISVCNGDPKIIDETLFQFSTLRELEQFVLGETNVKSEETNDSE